MLDLILRGVEVVVFRQIGDQPAAEQVERSPVIRAVQAGEDAFRGIARRAAGVDGFLDLARLRLLRGDFLLEL